MSKTSFYVCFSTSDTFQGDEYSTQAGHLVNMFTEVFTDVDKICMLTKNACLSACHTELDVSQDASGLRCEAVVDFHCEKKASLDKTKLSRMLKSGCEWSNVKIEKRAVPDADALLGSESEQTSHLVSEDAAVVA